MTDFTQILGRMENGDLAAAEQLLPLVYSELRRLAAAKMTHEQPGQTLQATALVHEAYLRLVGPTDKQRWNSRGHFFAAAAEAMRRILIENARRKKSEKHGGDLDRISFASDVAGSARSNFDLLSLDEALEQLAAEDARKASLVKLRLFAGLSLDDAAKVLEISPATAKRDWIYARAWLFGRLADLNSGEKADSAP